MSRNNFETITSLQLWQIETSLPSIPTYSQELDKILHGGIKLGTIVEIIGLPGTGKTQLCLQLAANVCIPCELQGLNGASIYLNTNNNFNINRYTEILRHSLMRCESLLYGTYTFDMNDCMKRLYHIECFGCIEFIACVRKIIKLVQTGINIRLIVIDSICFPFIYGVSETQRTGILFTLISQLQSIATQYRIALVVTNDMSTRLGLECELVGGLGDSWSHRVNNRLLLSCDNEIRHALLTKCKEGESTTAAPFKDYDHEANIAHPERELIRMY